MSKNNKLKVIIPILAGVLIIAVVMIVLFFGTQKTTGEPTHVV